MSVDLLSVCQFIRNVIREIVLISRRVTAINCLQNIFHLFCLYNITSCADERTVKLSACIWPKRPTMENIFCIRQTVESLAKCRVEEILRFDWKGAFIYMLSFG